MAITPKSSKKKVIPDLDFVGKFEVDGKTLSDKVEEIIGELDIGEIITPPDTSAVEALLDTRTLGDMYTVDDSTDEVDGSPGTYQVPDGTSIVTVNWEGIAAEVTLLRPDDAPSVILVAHGGDYMEKVLHWGSDTLSVCPMNLLIRAGADWMQVPLANAFEYRMKNDVFTYDGTEDTEPKTVSVPAGTGRIDCENLAQDVTLKINGVFYPQLIGIGNKDNSTGNVVFNGVTVEPDEFAVIMNLGSMWIEVPFGG